MLVWKKQADNSLKATEGPFVAHAMPKPDGRWDWKIFVDAGTNPTATGIRSSAGDAKTACENFVQRSGRV